MSEQRIFELIYIKTSLAAVWNALTNPEMTQQYWGGTRHRVGLEGGLHSLVRSQWRSHRRALGAHGRQAQASESYVPAAVC